MSFSREGKLRVLELAIFMIFVAQVVPQKLDKKCSLIPSFLVNQNIDFIGPLDMAVI